VAPIIDKFVPPSAHKVKAKPDLIMARMGLVIHKGLCNYEEN